MFQTGNGMAGLSLSHHLPEGDPSAAEAR